MIKRIKYFLFIVFVFLMFKPEVSAGSLSIWASASNVTVGSKVTISVNAKNIAGTFNVTSSDNSILSGGVTGEWLENNTYTFQSRIQDKHRYEDPTKNNLFHQADRSCISDEKVHLR